MILVVMLVLAIANATAATDHNLTLLYKNSPEYVLAPTKIDFLVVIDGNRSQPVKDANITITVLESGQTFRAKTGKDGVASFRLFMPIESVVLRQTRLIVTAEQGELFTKNQMMLRPSPMFLIALLATLVTVVFSISLTRRYMK